MFGILAHSLVHLVNEVRRVREPTAECQHGRTQHPRQDATLFETQYESTACNVSVSVGIGVREVCGVEFAFERQQQGVEMRQRSRERTRHGL